MRSNKAFTLIELLVVVAIICLLLSILAPSLGRAKELTRRAICASNQHHLAASCHTYASDNRCLLPKLHHNAAPMGKQPHPCPYFFDTPAVDKFTAEYVGNYRMFYCPSYLRNNLYNERGYCRSDPVYGNNHDAEWWWMAWPKLAGWVDYWRVAGYNITTHPSLAADFRLRTINDDGRKALIIDMNNTFSAFSDPWNVWVRAHWGATRPEGQNVGCLDGHVYWQVFEEMTPKYANGNDVWWW